MTRTLSLGLSVLVGAALLAPSATAEISDFTETGEIATLREGDLERSDRGTRAPRFLDRELLLDTALRDDLSREDALGAVDGAQNALDEALAAGASESEIADLEAQLMAARDDLAAVDTEGAALAEVIGELSDHQVIALNRFLNNTRHNGLIVDLDAETLAAVLEGDYDKHQISALTHALEAEARAARKAARFQARYDATGREKFLAHADRAIAHGETKRDRFLARIDGDTKRPHSHKPENRLRDRAEREERQRDRLDMKQARHQARADARSATTDARDAARQATREARDAAKAARREARAASRGRN